MSGQGPHPEEVKEALRLLQEVLGLQKWNICIEYRELPDNGDGYGAIGTSVTYSAYREATITLSKSDVDNLVLAVSVLRHELLHILLSPLDLCWTMVRPLLSTTTSLGEFSLESAVEDLIDHQEHRIIAHLEGVLDQVGYSPEVIAKRSLEAYRRKGSLEACVKAVGGA